MLPRNKAQSPSTMKSILQTQKECFICGTYRNLHEHHVYGGVANRPKSEKYGLKVYLCARHHNGSSASVHHNNKMKEDLEKFAQRTFEDKYSHEKFMEVFHKNYLWDEE